MHFFTFGPASEESTSDFAHLGIIYLPVVLSEGAVFTEPAPLPFDAPPANALDIVKLTEQPSFFLFALGPLVALKAKLDFAKEGCRDIPSGVRVAVLHPTPVAAPVGATPAALTSLTFAMSPPSATSISPPAMGFLSPFVKTVTPLNPELDGENIDQDFENLGEFELHVDVFANVAASASPVASIVLAERTKKNVQLPTETAAEIPWVWESHDHLIVIDTDFNNDAEHPDSVECLEFDVHHHSDLFGETNRERQAQELAEVHCT